MADLTVTVTDTITTGGRKAGAERAHTITGVNKVIQAIVAVPNSSHFNLLNFGASAAGLALAADNTLKYARFTNTGATHPIFLTFSNDAGSPPDKYINVEIPAGCSFTLFGDSIGGGASFTTTLNKLYRTAARATGGDTTMEVFYATT